MFILFVTSNYFHESGADTRLALKPPPRCLVEPHDVAVALGACGADNEGATFESAQRYAPSDCAAMAGASGAKVA